MPLTHYNCPDNQTRPVAVCLDKCPRPEGRCLSLPTLKTIGTTRDWTGKPSTTQLLNPTRMEYLKIMKPYAINPFDRAFALLGTRHHGRLEIVAQKIKELEAELKLDGEVTGILDLLEPLDGDSYRLIDYKTWGSYPTAKQLGLKEDGETDREHLALQMNNYRLMAEDLGVYKVAELKCQVTVRDGGTYAARNNGINFNLVMIPVPIMDDDLVRSYFKSRAKALVEAIANNELPELCKYEERWRGRRCKGYCECYRYCPEGAQVNRVKLEG